MPCTRSEQNCNLSAFNLSTLTSVSDCSVPATRSGDFFVFQKHRCIKILQFLFSKHGKIKHKYNKNDKRGFRRRKPPGTYSEGLPVPVHIGAEGRSRTCLCSYAFNCVRHTVTGHTQPYWREPFRTYIVQVLGEASGGRESNPPVRPNYRNARLQGSP